VIICEIVVHLLVIVQNKSRVSALKTILIFITHTILNAIVSLNTISVRVPFDVRHSREAGTLARNEY
jgi:uncharacterized membrane protein YjdF